MQRFKCGAVINTWQELFFIYIFLWDINNMILSVNKGLFFGMEFQVFTLQLMLRLCFQDGMKMSRIPRFVVCVEFGLRLVFTIVYTPFIYKMEPQ